MPDPAKTGHRIFADEEPAAGAGPLLAAGQANVGPSRPGEAHGDPAHIYEVKTV